MSVWRSRKGALEQDVEGRRDAELVAQLDGELAVPAVDAQIAVVENSVGQLCCCCGVVGCEIVSLEDLEAGVRCDLGESLSKLGRRQHVCTSVGDFECNDCSTFS